MRLQREMSRRQKRHRRIRNIPLECICTRRKKVRIKLAPHREQRRMSRPKILLKLRVQLHVVGIIKEQIQLDINVPRPRQQGSVQRVSLWFDYAVIRNSNRIFEVSGILALSPIVSSFGMFGCGK